MDFKTLIQQLDLDQPAAREIEVLKAAHAQLLLNLGAMFPQNLAVFDALNQDMRNRLNLIAGTNYNVINYFTGNGALAKKLREHLLLSKWLRGTSNALLTDHQFELLEEQLKAFNFKPTTNPQMVRALQLFITSIRPLVLAKLFRAPMPNLGPEEVLDQLKTGIYGDPTDSNQFIIVLRTEFEPRDQVETLLVYRPGEVNVWYYHPYEGKWINSDHSVTFMGILEQLQLEFQKALTAAEPMERAFDFEEELNIILARADDVFREEELLPNKMYCAPDRVEQNYPQLPTGYQRSMTDSFIIVSADTYSLIIRDTKGEYPNRLHHFTQNWLTSPAAVKKEDLSDAVKYALIKKARYAFGYFESIMTQERATKNK